MVEAVFIGVRALLSNDSESPLGKTNSKDSNVLSASVPERNIFILYDDQLKMIKPRTMPQLKDLNGMEKSIKLKCTSISRFYSAAEFVMERSCRVRRREMLCINSA